MCRPFTAMTRKVYKHQPLSTNDSIRLLRISRDDKLPHGIALSLIEAHLDDEPEFTALSYTWDLPHYVDAERRIGTGPGETFEVVCDGNLMTISENLFSFLCSALVAGERHSTTKAHATKLTPRVDGILAKSPIWIDAFCINQADADEKRHQVLVMHRIYSAARNVIIWLGSTQPTEDVLWVHDKFIPAVSRVAKSKPDFVRSYLSGDPTLRLPETVEVFGSELCFRWSPAWLAFSLFIDRQRWFDRGWIVQEVALADPASVYVLCGRAVLSWKRLAAFALFLHDTGWGMALSTQLRVRSIARGEYLDPHHEDGITSQTYTGLKMYKVSHARQLLVEVAQRTGLLNRNFGSSEHQRWEAENAWWCCADLLIHSLRSSQFGDPRDHIYGCLGMLSMILPEGVDSPIIPDYGRSVEEVFTATATEMVRELPLFWELSQVGLRSSRRYTNLPSWVPDYSVPLDQHTTLNRIFALNTCLGLSLEELKDVERGLWGIVRDEKRNEDFPCVRATYIATVSLVGDDTPYQWKSRMFHEKILDRRNSVRVTSLDDMLAEVGTFWQALKLVVHFKHRDGQLQPPEFRQKQTEEEFDFLSIAESQIQQAGQTRQASANRLDELEKSVKSELDRRYLYLTDSGGIGLGPLATQAHDEIWLIHGAWAPFILRKVKPKVYEFIGETDYDGFDIQSARYRKLPFQQIWLT